MVRKETVAPDLEKVDAVEHARGQTNVVNRTHSIRWTYL